MDYAGCVLIVAGIVAKTRMENEDKVRKWDAIILKGLGISYGEKRTIQELREIIGRKAPLDFCRTRCPWKAICTIFNLS